ncbi:unnamed protein product [Heligmosomoides polygyrus]|uniref:Homeobox domain-containing protein n=1 Tax=Heligmosomoides polygyrus TaxID=6339 RepID=A0A183GMP3_HELPZ|nr:unnamed protein product [Heligmosomoides polygyrus]
MSKTGGGRLALPRLSSVQLKAYEALECKPRLSGIRGGVEVGALCGSPIERNRESPIETNRESPIGMNRKSLNGRNAESSRELIGLETPADDDMCVQSDMPTTPSPAEQDRQGSGKTRTKCYSKTDLLAFQMENLRIRRQVLNKKNQLMDRKLQLVDLQMQYWSKKTNMINSI